MATANEVLLDRYIRHQTYILRYAAGLRNDLLPVLASTEKQLLDIVLAYVARAPDRVLAGADGRKWQKEFTEEVINLRGPAWQTIQDRTVDDLKQLAVMEAAQGAAAIEGSVPVVLGMKTPPVAQLLSIVNSSPFEGKTLKQWISRTKNADIERIVSLTKIGVSQGLTPTQVARNVVGSKSRITLNSAARKAFNDLEAVLLTTTNGVQQEAKQALYAANDDIIKEELFLSTLDIRTTLECAGNDGKVFPRGEGPIPPLHFRCRSLRVPYINPENLGDRPFNPIVEKQVLKEFTEKHGLPPVGSRGELPYGFKTKYDDFLRQKKRELIGQVPARTTFNDFLKRQSKEFQNEYLGPTRAEMFRRGEITIDQFTTQQGRTLSLEELNKKGYGLEDLISPPDDLENFKRFNSPEEADDYYKDNINITPNQEFIVKAYTNNYYKTLNNYMRGVTDDVSEDAIKDIAELDTFLYNNKTTEGLKVYRAINPTVLNSLGIGDEFVDRGFISTTITENFDILNSQGPNSLYMEILVPKNSPGTFIKQFSEYEPENEFLLKGGKFVVEGIEDRRVIVRYTEASNGT